ncbi:uncharacterized protein LOC126260337 [Schistocerca nitens]|uniref:uncharacterized protein LOC126260337 n=1 Tax=Schistocerca nitens TaxID=7011 RepID=UPI0021193F8C|nr:uncharacterized protein LOC126260337 [Schistocerca nitens]
MKTTGAAFQLAAAFLLSVISPVSVSAQGRVVQVRSVVNGTARLPCDLTPPSHNDSVILVIWFKNEKTAIYSFDARQRLSAPVESHWKHPQLVADRGLFSTMESPAELTLSRLQESDEAVYRCRVDFRLSASRNSRVRLTVVGEFQHPPNGLSCAGLLIPSLLTIILR